MGQITFKHKSFNINLSTHGYYMVYTNKMPTWKWSKIGGILEEGDIEKIGGKYLDDDVKPDIEELKGNAINYLKENYSRLKKLETIELKKWEEKQGKKVKGQNVCIGELVKFEDDGELFYLLGVEKNTVDGKKENGEIFSAGLNKRKLIKV